MKRECCSELELDKSIEKKVIETLSKATVLCLIHSCCGSPVWLHVQVLGYTVVASVGVVSFFS